MHTALKSLRFAPVFLTTALFAALVTLPARPAQANPTDDHCAYVTNGHALFSADVIVRSAVVSGGQVTMEPDDCTPPVTVLVTLSNGTVEDVSDEVTTLVPQGAGIVKGHFYCAADGDLNKQFPIYSIYIDPCTGQTHVFTLSIHVVANDHDADDGEM